MPPSLDRLRENSLRASNLLKAMSNEYRLMILCELIKGERSVGQLEEIIGISQSSMSQHLARLRRDGFVRPRRSGQTIFYSIIGDEVTAILETLYELYCIEPPAVAQRYRATG